MKFAVREFHRPERVSQLHTRFMMFPHSDLKYNRQYHHCLIKPIKTDFCYHFKKYLF